MTCCSAGVAGAQLVDDPNWMIVVYVVSGLVMLSVTEESFLQFSAGIARPGGGFS